MLRYCYRMAASRTRLTDIAEHAGVSVATVSRVLNGKATVSDATRRAVLAALDQLGYERPDRLRTNSAGLIGLVIPELNNPVFPAFAQYLERFLSDSKYTPLLCSQGPGGTTEDEYIEMLVEHRVAGIIFVSGLHADSRSPVTRYERLIGLGIPIVTVNGTNPDLAVPTFAMDDRAAMEMAVRHLVSLGHRHIGLAAGQDRFFPTLNKIEGFTAAIGRHLGNAEAHIVSTLYTTEGGRTAAASLLADGVTGIVAASDLMALGAISQVRAQGMRVPDDVSVVGCDDSPLMAFTNPPLTTVRQPGESICRSVVATLLSMIEGVTVPNLETLFTPELVVRGSTGANPRRTSS